jgi:hypothetical protein
MREQEIIAVGFLGYSTEKTVGHLSKATEVQTVAGRDDSTRSQIPNRHDLDSGPLQAHAASSKNSRTGTGKGVEDGLRAGPAEQTSDQVGGKPLFIF